MRWTLFRKHQIIRDYLIVKFITKIDAIIYVMIYGIIYLTYLKDFILILYINLD